jgi:hypothetical protein
MQDGDYFGAIAREMDNAGRAALLDLLLNRDLCEFDVRKVPQTAALADQKARTRRGVDLLIEHIALEGVIPAGHMTYSNRAITSGEADGKGFHVAARTLVPDLKYLASTVLVRQLKEEWGCKAWASHGQRGLEFPKLSELRASFDKKYGPQDWSNGTDWELA